MATMSISEKAYLWVNHGYIWQCRVRYIKLRLLWARSCLGDLGTSMVSSKEYIEDKPKAGVDESWGQFPKASAESASNIERQTIYAAGLLGDETVGSSDGPDCPGAPACPPNSAVCAFVAVCATGAALPFELASSEAPPIGASM
jgi:hypothetical protein